MIRVTQAVIVLFLVWACIHSIRIAHAAETTAPAAFANACRNVGGEVWVSNSGQRVGCIFERNASFVKSLDAFQEAQAKLGDAAGDFILSGANQIKKDMNK